MTVPYGRYFGVGRPCLPLVWLLLRVFCFGLLFCVYFFSCFSWCVVEAFSLPIAFPALASAPPPQQIVPRSPKHVILYRRELGPSLSLAWRDSKIHDGCFCSGAPCSSRGPGSNEGMDVTIVKPYLSAAIAAVLVLAFLQVLCVQRQRTPKQRHHLMSARATRRKL